MTLREAFDLARETARLHPSPENREAVKAAWTALEAVAPKQRPPSKVRDNSAAARSGRRQHAEMEA